MRWFLTQKLSWNDTNPFPHSTFWWEGIDGSRVFTHFPPVATYNSGFSGAELARAVRDYAERGRGTRSLVPFGHGDGGGGPTREMLERARRLRDLEGSARVVIEDPDRFFDAAAAEYPDAPVWSGELYLELHRGTYTTQARTKAGNRRSEHLLREAELWAATAAMYRGSRYPYDELDRLWKTVLLNQFHDILPGSSIAWVHREAEATNARVHDELAGIVSSALGTLAGPPAPGVTWVCNAGPFPRADVSTVDGDPTYVMAPALGIGTPSGAPPAPVTVTDRTLDNGLVRLTFDTDGLFTSVYDLVAGRELLAPGARGNLLQLHQDRPSQWDAWDIERHYRHGRTDLAAATSVRVVDAGPLVGAVRVEREFGASRIVQTVTLRAGSARIDVATDLDWQEREVLLKVAFPLDVHADRSAAEIQFGHVYRPTHANTSWDAARFEQCAHRWIHVGEAGYAAAVLTDATYGYDATRNTRPDGGTTTTVRLSLVRAPGSPDPQADRGRHRFTYALRPGAGLADAVADGYALNLPLRVVAAGAAPPPPLVSVDGDAVVVAAVKLADDRSGDVIVRLYESLGGRATTLLHTGFPLARVSTVDLLERPLPGQSLPGPELAPAPDGGFELTLRPFEIRTLRLAPVPDGRRAT
jgi:alpha-mannosidase